MEAEPKPALLHFLHCPPLLWRKSVKSGKEAARSIEKNSQPDYRERLEEELAAIADQEMWVARS